MIGYIPFFQISKVPLSLYKIQAKSATNQFKRSAIYGPGWLVRIVYNRTDFLADRLDSNTRLRCVFASALHRSRC